MRFILFAVAAVYAGLLYPYMRGLWWLHRYQVAPASLVLPVRGGNVTDLTASFGAPRAGGPHEGIDLLAASGTPVVAAADGIIIGNRRTEIGGTVLWIMGFGRRLYYYAHLRELAPGMHLGRLVRAGNPIGTVGNTGNAVNTPPHLHFGIYVVTSDFYPLHYEAIDPYPLLVAAPR